jgi:Golgi SNAP receptor complex protein 2
MASVSSAFPQVQRVSLRLHGALDSFERTDGLGDNSEAAEAAIAADLQSLVTGLVECEQLAERESGQRKEMWKKRVAALRDECMSMRLAFDRAAAQAHRLRRAQHEQKVRAELLSSNASGKPSASAVDHLSLEHTSLESSHRIIDDTMDMGRSALASLASQRNRLKGAHRKVLDIANILGMSGSLLKVGERKEAVNAIITYGCMILTVIIVIALYYYLRVRS